MSAHTPGPWSLETVPTSCGICHKVGPFPGKRPDGKPRHACLYADYPSKSNPADDELAANARLITAAPEMLAALIVARQVITTDRTAFADCSTGPDNAMEPDDAAALAEYDEALRQIDAAIRKATGEQP